MGWIGEKLIMKDTFKIYKGNECIEAVFACI